MITATASSRYDLTGLFGEGAGPRDRGLLRYMRLTDPVVLLLWVIFTSVPNEGASLQRYACVAYFAAGMALFARQTFPTYARGWPLLILPTLCLISTLWAPSVNDAIRKGVFMGLSGVIAVYAANRLSARQVITIYFLGEIYGCLLTLLNPNIVGGNWTGPFGQKNFLAVHMFILYVTGFALMLDKGSNRWLRIIAVLFVLTSGFIIVMTKSATTFLLVIGSSGAFLGHFFLWGPARRVRHLRTLIIFLLLLVALGTMLLVFGLLQVDAKETLLNALGKDSTLTGRTFIWDWGRRIMDEHPWTGLGANGFWRPEVGVANQITTYFYYGTFVKFSFHNSYIENGVQFGYPGYYATMFIAAWGLWCAARNWMRNQTLINVVFLIIVLMVVIRSNSEVDLAGELSGTFTIFYLSAIRREKRSAEEKPLRKRRWPMTGQILRMSGR